MSENNGNGEGVRDDGLVPSGVQWVKAIPSSFTMGQAGTEAEQIGIAFEITKGIHAKRTLPWYGFLTEKAKVRTFEQLALAGVTFKDGMPDLSGLGSKEIECQVECSETPDGEMRSRISWLGPPGVGMKTTYNKDQIAAVFKRFKGDIVAAQKAGTLGAK